MQVRSGLQEGGEIESLARRCTAEPNAEEVIKRRARAIDMLKHHSASLTNLSVAPSGSRTQVDTHVTEGCERRGIALPRDRLVGWGQYV